MSLVNLKMSVQEMSQVDRVRIIPYVQAFSRPQPAPPLILSCTVQASRQGEKPQPHITDEESKFREVKGCVRSHRAKQHKSQGQSPGVKANRAEAEATVRVTEVVSQGPGECSLVRQGKLCQEGNWLLLAWKRD